MSAQQYRKKPVVVEAVLFNGSSSQANILKQWMAGQEYVHHPVMTRDLVDLEIETLEGTMTARPGDWIVKGVQGEFYPVKGDIFLATYEPA